MAVTGIDDADREKQINRFVTYNKGIFVTNIERPVKVTHLLCSGDEKTEKMKYAERFNLKGEASIKSIWEEWFWDCLHFGGTSIAYSLHRIIHPTFVSRSLARGQILGHESTAQTKASYTWVGSVSHTSRT